LLTARPAKNPQYADVSESTAGVNYLGTPFDGSPPSLIAAVICEILSVFGTDGRLLRTLSLRSDELAQLSERFISCTSTRGLLGISAFTKRCLPRSWESRSGFEIRQTRKVYITHI